MKPPFGKLGTLSEVFRLFVVTGSFLFSHSPTDVFILPKLLFNHNSNVRKVQHDLHGMRSPCGHEYVLFAQIILRATVLPQHYRHTNGEMQHLHQGGKMT